MACTLTIYTDIYLVMPVLLLVQHMCSARPTYSQQDMENNEPCDDRLFLGLTQYCGSGMCSSVGVGLGGWGVGVLGVRGGVCVRVSE